MLLEMRRQLQTPAEPQRKIVDNGSIVHPRSLEEEVVTEKHVACARGATKAPVHQHVPQKRVQGIDGDCVEPE